MAGQYLVDLPSRGFFGSSVFPSSNPDGLRVYVCDHDTAPPEDQVIKTDSTNILIRSLTLKKAKADAKPRDNKRKTLVENGKGKRPAEKPLDDKLTVKRANSSGITVSSKKATKDHNNQWVTGYNGGSNGWRLHKMSLGP